jgi:hypothetical protein
MASQPILAAAGADNRQVVDGRRQPIPLRQVSTKKTRNFTSSLPLGFRCNMNLAKGAGLWPGCFRRNRELRYTGFCGWSGPPGFQTGDVGVLTGAEVTGNRAGGNQRPSPLVLPPARGVDMQESCPPTTARTNMRCSHLPKIPAAKRLLWAILVCSTISGWFSSAQSARISPPLTIPANASEETSQEH